MKNFTKNLYAFKGLSLLVILLLLLSTGCVQEEKSQSPIIGTWKLVSWEGTTNDGSVTQKYPGDVELFDQMFIYSEGYFLFSGIYKIPGDSVIHKNYGGGSYTYNMEDYTETIMYFVNDDYIGRTLSYNLEISGDTLIKKGPLNAEDFWGTLTETYIRMK